jgi:hypothetical protein
MLLMSRGITATYIYVYMHAFDYVKHLKYEVWIRNHGMEVADKKTLVASIG